MLCIAIGGNNYRVKERTVLELLFKWRVAGDKARWMKLLVIECSNFYAYIEAKLQ